MILNQNSELKVIQVLTKNWFREFSAYQLAKAAKITPPMAYKAIKNLNKHQIITQTDSKVKINFQTHFAYQFKLLQDAEKFSLLPKDIQQKVDHIYQVLKSEYQTHLLSFLIFGSVASNETNEKSDLDLLAIVTEKKEIDYRKKGLFDLGKINLIEKTPSEWEKDFLMGHDLVLNVLINGIIIHDNGILRNFFQKPLPKISEEVIVQKKEHLNILKDRILLLLKDQDYHSLEDIFKQYILEKARIILLQDHLIPSSKKDILAKIKDLDPDIYKLYSQINLKNIKSLVKQYVWTS